MASSVSTVSKDEKKQTKPNSKKQEVKKTTEIKASPAQPKKEANPAFDGWVNANFF